MKNKKYFEENKRALSVVDIEGQEMNWISPELDFREIVSHYRRSLISESTISIDGPYSTFLKSYLYAVKLVGKKAVKRLLDLFISLLLLIFFAPVLLIIVILIKLDSRGPAIFTQMRIGVERRRNHVGDRRGKELEELDNRFRDRRAKNFKGRPFKIYKFRSMTTGSSKYETVGPRPEMPFLVVEYNDYHAIRLQMKPGITGLWQLYGRRDIPIHQNLSYDLEYIRNWSLGLDVRIFLKTIWAVFTGINV
jgi:lipopolysaccharide/colanic/teichoic acid biosynthesis glycosyltransferase